MFGLVAVAAAAWLFSQLGADRVAPPDSSPREAALAPREAPLPAERRAGQPREPVAAARERGAPTSGAQASNAPAAAEAPSAAAATEATEARYPAYVEVRDAATSALVRAFSYRFSSAQNVDSGACEGGRGALRLPWGRTGELLLEAAGMQPRVFERFTLPDRSAPPRRLEVYLTPTAPAVGITLLVHDIDRQPVVDVRVDAFALPAEGATPAWHLGQPRWSRAASDDRGRYALPPLAAGRHGVTARAVDADGLPLPLAPFRQVFELTGGNGYLEDVTLEPACALRLELVDPYGAPLDLTGRGPVSLKLARAGQPAVPRRWVSRSEGSAGRVSEVDRVPGPSPVWLAEAVAPGAYVLEVAVAGRVVAQRPLQLMASVQRERVVVP